MSQLAATRELARYDVVPVAMNAPEYPGAPDLNGRFSDVRATAASEYPAPRVDPLCYPGRRPRHSFTTDGRLVRPVRVVETLDGPVFGVNTEDGVRNLDTVLNERGTTPMADRIPVIAFGSNACPGQVTEKFAEANDRHGDITEEADRLIVPTLQGTMWDVAAAYSARLGLHGYVFAELIKARSVAADIFINFLTPGQFNRMVRSESAYEFCDLGQVAVGGLAQAIKAYGFAGKNEVMLDAAGRPILLADIHPQGVDLPAMTQPEVLGLLARDLGPQLKEIYPHAPVPFDSAANLVANQLRRREWLRRADTKAAQYAHHPEPGQAPDELLTVTVQNLLWAAGRASSGKLLDTLPPEQRNVTPETFGSLYTAR